MIYRLVSILLLVGITAGCRDRRADSLLGRWLGQADTVADQEARETARYQSPAARSTAPAPPANGPQGALSAAVRPAATMAVETSDWERYDVRILLEFRRSQQVTMSLADGSEPRAGIWRVVHTTPAGLVIEIKTRGSGQEIDQPIPTMGESQVERRRFELQLDYDTRSGKSQECVGFRLIELGADPRLGALYFKREKSS